jgi:hypothetical protein
VQNIDHEVSEKRAQTYLEIGPARRLILLTVLVRHLLNPLFAGSLGFAIACLCLRQRPGSGMPEIVSAVSRFFTLTASSHAIGPSKADDLKPEDALLRAA